jgi:hypothetical protein
MPADDNKERPKHVPQEPEKTREPLRKHDIAEDTKWDKSTTVTDWDKPRPPKKP